MPKFKRIKGELIYLFLCIGLLLYTLLCSVGVFHYWTPNVLQYILEILLIIGSLLRIKSELKAKK